MPRVGIVYFSKTDITGKLVKAAASEIKSNGLDVFEHKIQGHEIIEGRFKNKKLFE